eukprot:bmy_07086T0
MSSETRAADHADACTCEQRGHPSHGSIGKREICASKIETLTPGEEELTYSRTFQEVSAAPVSKTSVFAFAGTFPTLPRKELTRTLALVKVLLARSLNAASELIPLRSVQSRMETERTAVVHSSACRSRWAAGELSLRLVHVPSLCQRLVGQGLRSLPPLPRHPCVQASSCHRRPSPSPAQPASLSSAPRSGLLPRLSALCPDCGHTGFRAVPAPRLLRRPSRWPLVWPSDNLPSGPGPPRRGFQQRKTTVGSVCRHLQPSPWISSLGYTAGLAAVVPMVHQPGHPSLPPSRGPRCLVRERNLDWFPRMRAMSLVSSDSEGEQNELRNLQEKLESTMKLVTNLSGQLSELKDQMTEQRKQKQRIGLLGHPPHMNVNPQQPA